MVICVAILALVPATCALLRKGNRPVRLKDGSLLGVASIRYGRTNQFLIGNFVERTFGRFLPRAGISLFGFKLAPPERIAFSGAEGTKLAIMFRLQNANDPGNPLLPANLYQHSRLLLISDDGFAYYGRFGGFLKHGKAYYGFGSATAFPQEGRDMRIRIELMKGGDWRKQIAGTWRSLAEFRVRNPGDARPESWIADPAQLSKRVGDLEVALGGVLVVQTPTNFAITRPDFCAMVPFQTRFGGQTSTNWRAHDIVLSDSVGNSIAPCSPISITNGWRNYASWGVLDPRRVWKVHAEFALDSGFSGDELCTLQVQQYPLANPLRTNFHGIPVQAEYDPIEIDKLAIYLTNPQEGTRLTLVNAHNEDGHPLHGWSDSQHKFSISINVPKAGTIVTTTFAIHKNVPLEFFTQPKLTEPLGMIGRASVNESARSP